MKNSTVILFLIILTTTILRLSFIGSYPNGLSNDEAALGYNAYSILKTGRDEYGEFLPLAFRSFGEYKAPLYIYATVPFIALFGLSEFSVRLPSLIFAVSMIIFLYLLVYELSKKQVLALLSAFILAITPWYIQFTRIAYEGNSAIFLLVAATLFFVKGLKSLKFFIISFVLFSLILYSHFAVRLFVPLYIVYLLFIFRNELFKYKRKLFLGFIAAILTLVPLFPHLFSQSGLTRAKYISFTMNPAVIAKIDEKRLEFNINSNSNLPLLAKLYYNKATEYTYQFLYNYFSHFNPIFLFFEGDGDQIFNTPNTGPLLISFLPFIFLGLYSLTKYKKLFEVISGWLLLAIIPSSLTRLSASTNRAFIMLIPLVIIIGSGFNLFMKNIKSKKMLFMAVIYIFFISAEYILYLNSYYIHLPLKREYDARVGSKDVINFVNDNSFKYDAIWVDDSPQAYIQYLFYIKYPPPKFQKEAILSSLNEFGFGDINRFGKYFFNSDIREDGDKALYISKREGSPDGFYLKKTFYRLDGSANYFIYDNL